jgi:hypothetical protein
MSRYQWKKVCDSPQRHQLFDSITERIVGTVEESGDCWKWQRTTSYLSHRAHPAIGTAETLILGKISVVHDFPEEE